MTKKQWEGIGQTPTTDYDQAHAALRRSPLSNLKRLKARKLKYCHNFFLQLMNSENSSRKSYGECSKHCIQTISTLLNTNPQLTSCLRWKKGNKVGKIKKGEEESASTFRVCNESESWWASLAKFPLEIYFVRLSKVYEQLVLRCSMNGGWSRVRGSKAIWWGRCCLQRLAWDWKVKKIVN